ncbi:MAG TPA: UDP-N-acetylmuramoyl-L-alanyl-D-glutamate--2,6-diaminopimelate ligase, partial [Gammaproteobacteria bacterium]|nr:UDP-N-acetylmuramoyl-L-alanyl-D-glutamate--2,6-diaminopimelate ligase [Gammaproteobacteria bacterium]
RPGDLFLAQQGGARHGAEFIEDAVHAGAVAVAVESNATALTAHTVPIYNIAGLGQKIGPIAARFYGHPSHDFTVIGVTGTNGKTSVTHFLAQALSSPCGVVGTLGNGIYGQLETGSHTTPDAVTLQALLAQLHERGATNVVMEVSSHGLEQGRVNGVEFDIAVFTNLSRDHLDYHPDMTAYGAAKRRLFQMPGLRHAVINSDDDYGRELLSMLPKGVQPLAFGLSAYGVASVVQVRGMNLRLHSQGLSLDVESPWGSGRLESALWGRFNASNLLAALAVLLTMGVPLADALQRLSRVSPVPGRMELIAGRADLPTVIVDYAHSPDALQQALAAVREHTGDGQGRPSVAGTGRPGATDVHGSTNVAGGRTPGATTGRRVWCVFGCGGGRDRGKRPLMGAIAERYADFVVVTDDNPRHEDPVGIVAEILGGMTNPYAVYVRRDRAEALAFAIRHAGAADIILVAGKGHEDYQLIGAEKIPFSDREQVAKLLAAREK